MFLDDAEQVFILVFDVWMRFRQNREKIQIILILITAIAYKFNKYQHEEYLREREILENSVCIILL